MRLPVWIVLILACCGAAYGGARDPPARVARLSYLTSAASFRDAATRELHPAIVNSPLTPGDRLVTARESRAEVSLGAATIRIDQDTEIVFLKIDHDVTEVRIQSGTMNIRLRELQANEAFGIKVNRASVQLLRPGNYRISVLRDGNAEITVRDGEAKVNTGTASFQQLAGEVAQIGAANTVAIERSRSADAFDRWSLSRQREFSGERSAMHVARGVVGHEDLDVFGTWHWEREYGMVWTPTRVADAWAPYRFGQWIWKEPWGWTWVDAAPWGFAPFHYGRWVQLHARWCWLPSPRQLPAVYAPALVGWTEDNADRNVIGWFPLGPRERYTPSYAVSSQHAQRLNMFASVSGSNSLTAQTQRDDKAAVDAITWAERSIFDKRTPFPTSRVEHLASD